MCIRDSYKGIAILLSNTKQIHRIIEFNCELYSAFDVNVENVWSIHTMYSLYRPIPKRKSTFTKANLKVLTCFYQLNYIKCSHKIKYIFTIIM